MAQPSVQINTSTGDTTILTAPTGSFSFIAVLGYSIIANAACNVSWKDNYGNTYDGPFNLAAAGNGLVWSKSGSDYLFILPKGAALVLHQDSTAQLGGRLDYKIIMP